METTRDGSAPQTVYNEILVHGTITSSNTTLQPVTDFPLVMSPYLSVFRIPVMSFCSQPP